MENIHQNLIALESRNLPAIAWKKRRRSSGIQEESKDGITEENLRKITHRDSERLRRQEMANLYASLRSLLPLEYIKGKRSMSGRELHKSLANKNMRIALAELSTSSSGHVSSEKCSCRCSIVTASLCPNGQGILISCRHKDEVFVISTVLRKMLGEGLNVIR